MSFTFRKMTRLGNQHGSDYRWQRRAGLGWLAGSLLTASSLVLLTGCVERTVKIDSHPTKAQVVINDEEVGVTPVKFSFKWYGDYDLVLRKEGYETLKTDFRLNPPWWQVPPFDLMTEVFVASTIRDDRELEPFELAQRETGNVSGIVARAEQLRLQSRDIEAPRVTEEAAAEETAATDTLEPTAEDSASQDLAPDENASVDDTTATQTGGEQEVLQPVE